MLDSKSKTITKNKIDKNGKPEKGPRKRYYHDIYKKITPLDRLNVIYNRQVHNMSLYDITSNYGIKYNTVRNIINTYINTGRTNKKRYVKPENAMQQRALLMNAPAKNG